MEGQGSNSSKSHWHPGYAPHWNSGEVSQDGVRVLKPSVPSANKDARLDTVVSETAAEMTVVTKINHHDDKMVSWLQYPLHDSLERKYCSDVFGELPSSNIQVVKESFVGQEPCCLPHISVPNNIAINPAVNKATCAEVAMTLGAGRAAGIIPQRGAEAFSKVRTLTWQPDSLTPNSSRGFGVYSSASQAPPRTYPPASRPLLAPFTPLNPQPRASMHNMQPDSARKLAHFDFLDFSRSAARMKNLQGIGMLPDTPSNMLCTQPLAEANVEASTSSWSTFADSSTAGTGQMGSQKNIEIHVQGTKSQQQIPGVDDEGMVPISVTRKEVEASVLESEAMIWKTQLPVPIPVIRKEVETVSEGEAVLCKTKPTEQEVLQMSNVAGGHGNSAGMPKEASTSNKRKVIVTEELECQSEDCSSKMAFRVDGEDQSADFKKPPEGRASTSKRTRTAEVHNRSERCRRDRINEKMKALQMVIPNCNKTDKASLLAEAVEYIKMLQLQLQMVSSTGKSIPPMVMPSGMQHLQMQAPETMDMSSLGMGMAMRMGMDPGMSLRDMAASNSGQAGMLLPFPAGPSHNCYIPVTSLSMVNVHNLGVHNLNAMEPLNDRLTCHHQPLQIPKQQQQYQQREQQQQHHHHQSTNMGGVQPPQ
ncbi:unnamed protein product [Sphagnum jensenii]|uniref:BHLH domain-containing protein n=1 Tax=Sphagnum jensenii TaxID=128206 RepID=A0ABP1AZT2_9BRYO